MLTDDAFELMDTQSGNLVGTYPTRDAALENVRWAVEQYGESSMATVALGGEDDAGELVMIAFGDDLIRLAFPQGVPAFASS